MKKNVTMILMLAVFGLAACGTKFPPPDSQINEASLAIGQAESVGAYESAPVEIAAAREQLNQAKQAMLKDDNLTARRLADQATSDANLAQAKARTAKSQRAVAELKEGIRILQEEIDRKSVR